MVIPRVYALTAAAIVLLAVGAMDGLHAQPAASPPAPGVATSSTTTTTTTTTKQVTPAPAADAKAAGAEERERPLLVNPADPKVAWGKCPALFPAGCQVAVLHGDPAQPGADVLLRVPPAYTIPAHWHTSAERMVLVSGELEVTYAGHPTTTLRSGDYAYGPAKLPHVARCRSADPCTLFIAFNSAMDAHPFEGDLAKAR